MQSAYCMSFCQLTDSHEIWCDRSIIVTLDPEVLYSVTAERRTCFWKHRWRPILRISKFYWIIFEIILQYALIFIKYESLMDNEIKGEIKTMEHSAYSRALSCPGFESVTVRKKCASWVGCSNERVWRSVRCECVRVAFGTSRSRLIWGTRGIQGPQAEGCAPAPPVRVLYWDYSVCWLLVCLSICCVGCVISRGTVICKWARLCVIVTLPYRVQVRLARLKGVNSLQTEWRSTMRVKQFCSVPPWNGISCTATFSVLTWQHEIMQPSLSDVLMIDANK
jgi:hypothetical protein